MKLANFDFRIWDKGEKTLTYASERVEVLGNIHENADLLKKEKEHK